MISIKIKAYLAMVLITGLLFVSCDSDDDSSYNVTEQEEDSSIAINQPQNSGNILASVNVTSDITVNFVEVGEGNVFIATTQSMDSNKETSQSVNELIAKGKSNIEIYNSLANNDINPTYVANLKQADSKFEIFKKKVKNGEITIQPFTDFSLDSNKNNAQKADCDDPNNNNFSRDWFLNNFVNNGKAFTHGVNIPASFSTPVSLGDPDVFGIDRMEWTVCNGNFSKRLIFQMNFTSQGDNNLTADISPRTYVNYFFYAPFSGNFRLELQSKNACLSTHYAVDLINTIR